MRQPVGQWQQYEGKGDAELWRGCGRWPPQRHPCRLEPPWEAFDRRTVNAWDCVVNNWETAWDAGYVVFNPDQPLVLPELAGEADAELVPINVGAFSDGEAAEARGQRLLLSLPSPKRPVAFELVGVGAWAEYDNEKLQQLLSAKSAELDHRASVSEILSADPGGFDEAIVGWKKPAQSVRFVVHPDDAENVSDNLLASYPNAAVAVGSPLAHDEQTEPAADLRFGTGYGASFSLESPYCFLLEPSSNVTGDPLAAAIEAIAHVGKSEWAMVQVLFEPARQAWTETVREAVKNPDKPAEYLFSELTDEQLDAKFSGPLFAVTIRVMAKSQHVYNRLLGWASQWSTPSQGLVSMDEREHIALFASAVKDRGTYRPGVLLNAAELACLVHLPAGS